MISWLIDFLVRLLTKKGDKAATEHFEDDRDRALEEAAVHVEASNEARERAKEIREEAEETPHEEDPAAARKRFNKRVRSKRH